VGPSQFTNNRTGAEGDVSTLRERHESLFTTTPAVRGRCVLQYGVGRIDHPPRSHLFNALHLSYTLRVLLLRRRHADSTWVLCGDA
jgi:hypothetical protein